jgi:hypothetical protein
VAHHDPAYDWASRRKIEIHPVTPQAQIVEIRETVRENQILLHVPGVVATNLHPGGRSPTSLKAIHHQIERDHTDLDTFCVAPWMPSPAKCS